MQLNFAVNVPPMARTIPGPPADVPHNAGFSDGGLRVPAGIVLGQRITPLPLQRLQLPAWGRIFPTYYAPNTGVVGSNITAQGAYIRRMILAPGLQYTITGVAVPTNG